MSLKMIKPFDIDDSIMTSSIAEPDLSQGEEEWSFGSDIDTISGASSSDTYYASVAVGNSIYSVGDAGVVLETNTTTQALSTFGTYTGTYNAIALGVDGFAYAVGDSGVILKINTTAKTVSTFGTYSGEYNAIVSAGNEYLYCVGSTGSMLKIDIENGTTSLVTASTGTYNTATINSSGVIYCAGTYPAQVLKINTVDDSVSPLGNISGTFYGSCEGLDGNMYFAGFGSSIGGVVVYVDTSSDTVNSFGRFSQIIRSLSLFPDGLIYGIGWSAVVLVIDTDTKSIRTFGSFSYTYNTSTLLNGYIYCHGDSGLSLKFSSAGYFEGETAILADNHKIYQAASFTTDEPLIGAELTPPTWVEVSATNKYKAFDYVINTKSVFDSSTLNKAIVTITPGKATTNLAIFGLARVTGVNVRVFEDSAAGTQIYPAGSATIDMTLDAPADDLAVNEAYLGDKIIFDDLPDYTNPHIIIIFRSDDDTCEVGDIVIGNSRTLGVTTYQSSTSRTSYDTVDTDDFGNETVTSRPSAEYTSFEVMVYPEYANYVERILKDSLNKPRVYVGDKGNDEKIFTLGYYERSPLTYSSPTVCETTLKVRGLV